MVQNAVVPINQSISTLLLRKVFGIYFLIALLMTSIHMYLEYTDTKDFLLEDLTMFESTLNRGIGEALWNEDTEILSAIMIGMLKHPAIIGVKVLNEDKEEIILGGTILRGQGKKLTIDGILFVEEDDGTQLKQETSPAKGGIFSEIFEISSEARSLEAQKVTGKVVIYTDTNVVFNRVKSGFFMILLNAIFKTIALWTIFLVFSRKLLRKPLIIFTNATKQINLDNLENIKIDVGTSGRNELKVLEEAFNSMIQKLHSSMKKQKKAENNLRQLNEELEQRVKERTQELNETLGEVKEANQQIMASIQYAQHIQNSLLPNLDEVKSYLPNSFFIWKPRDIVGGDIFYTHQSEQGYLVVVVDCTGHGVPGAFMTMLASSALRRIIDEEGCLNPQQILKRLNFIVTTSLQQNTEHVISDDGLDAAICFIQLEKDSLQFAGAKLPLIYTHQNEIHMIKGDKQSIGYKNPNLDFDFTNHTIELAEDMVFYLFSDGFSNQLGGEKGFPFGNRRFTNLLKEHSHQPFDKQEKNLLAAIIEYQGEHERQDDLTLIGFGL